MEFKLKYIFNKGIKCYFAALLLITLIFLEQSLPFIWFCWGSIEVLLFASLSRQLYIRWKDYSPKIVSKKIFFTSFVISTIYVTISFFLYSYLRGEPFEYDPSDGLAYHQEAMWFVDEWHKDNLSMYWDYFKRSHVFSDTGYLLYLNHLYVIIDSNIYITRIIKALFSAIMCVSVYKLSLRHFDNKVALCAALFCVFLPNFTFYTASHRKEAEMLFLVVFAIERFDYAIYNKKLKIQNFILPFLILPILFTFRTVLGIAYLVSIISTLFFINHEILSKWKKTAVLSVLIILLMFVGGNVILQEMDDLLMTKLENTQGKDMEWRSKVRGGNTYAKYASAAIFAPLITVIPFPTMVDVNQQYNLQRLNGAYYIKNIMGFFVLYSLFYIFRHKKWKEHILIYSYTFSYLIMLALSNFAHSERFHLPALPFLMIMAAYGISIFDFRKHPKAFSVYVCFIFIVVISWNIFKLAGRGLV